MRGRRGQSFTLLVSTLIGTMDSNALIPVIAVYAGLLGADLWMTGLIVAMYSIVHIPANIILGRLADKIGRKIPLMIGLSLDAISVFLYSLAQNPVHLLMVRAAHGLGGGFVGPSTMALAAGMAPKERKGRMMALYGIAIAFSVLIGFMLSGVVMSRFEHDVMLGYDILFYVLSASLIVAVGFALFVKESEDFKRMKTDFREDLRNFLEILKRKLAMASYLSVFFLLFALGAFTVLAPLYMRQFGMTTVNVATGFSAFAVMSIIVHYPSGWLSDRIGTKVPVTFGFLTVALSLFLIPFFSDLPALISVMALFGVGHGLLFPSASAMVAHGSVREERGLATGIFYAMLVAGVAIGAPVAGFMASVFTIEIGIWISGIVVLVGLPAVLRLLRKK